MWIVLGMCWFMVCGICCFRFIGMCDECFVYGFCVWVSVSSWVEVWVVCWVSWLM